MYKVKGKLVIHRLSCVILALGSLLFGSLPSYGQTNDTTANDTTAGEFLTNSDHNFQAKALSLKVEGIAFFRDNEYDSDISKGYTLPGAWLHPAVEYNPLDNIHLELGVHGLFYDGANKYPNYAYHDIAKWKGNQYQSGVHLLPWLRAEMKMGKFDIILGDIYGGTEHQFITPLYNKESVLSADPEMGAQILFGSRAFKADVFANWQSFQFNLDSHQEAFTVGGSTVTSPFKADGWKNLSLNIQGLVQHRGGELDDTDYGVQTLCTGVVGLAWNRDFAQHFFNHLRLDADVIGCYQQAGKLWSFESGVAYNASATMTFFHDIHAQLGYFLTPGNFISLYGNPYFSTISTKNTNLKFTDIKTAYLDFGYSHTWEKAYTFGANLEAFNAHPGGGKNEFVFSFGLYMIFKPEFRLK